MELLYLGETGSGWTETISSFGNNVAFPQEGKFSFTNIVTSTNRLFSLHFQINLMTRFIITSSDSYSFENVFFGQQGVYHDLDLYKKYGKIVGLVHHTRQGRIQGLRTPRGEGANLLFGQIS